MGYEYGYKIDDWKQTSGMDGTYPVTRTLPDGSTLSFTITISNSDGDTVDWSSTYPISAVIVKAGRGANVFYYDPPATGDTGLYGYRDKEISHVTFCFDGPAAPTGSLTIDKEIMGVDIPAEFEKKDFTLTVSGPSFPTAVEVPGSQLPKTWDDLIPGTYTVGEVDAGPSWTVSGAGDVTVEADGSVSKTVTNTYNPPSSETGSLSITKRIVDSPNDNWTPDDFSVIVTGPSPSTAVVYSGTFPEGGTRVLNDLAPGSYTVTEPGPGGRRVLTTFGVALGLGLVLSSLKIGRKAG